MHPCNPFLVLVNVHAKVKDLDMYVFHTDFVKVISTVIVCQTWTQEKKISTSQRTVFLFAMFWKGNSLQLLCERSI